MYPSLEIYQFKQPALPHTKSSKQISAQIIAKYIGTPQNYAIPMYLNFLNPSKIPVTPQKHLQIYQKKQPALPHTKSFKRISAQIIVRLTRAGVFCEGEQVYSREIIVKDIKSPRIIVKDIKSPRIKVKYIKNAKPNSKTQKQKQKTLIAKNLKFPIDNRLRRG